MNLVEVCRVNSTAINLVEVCRVNSTAINLVEVYRVNSTGIYCNTGKYLSNVGRLGFITGN